MKTYIANIIAAMILVACSGNKTSEATEPIADKGQSADTVEIKANADSASVDGVSSATNVANSPTFNGVMMVSPQQNATLSLTMGGKVHSLKVMPGQAVSSGQVVATIDNPEYIELQQTYLDASAQTEFLEKEYKRQTALGANDAASQKKVQQSKAEYLSMHSRLAAASSRLKALGIKPSNIKSHGIQPYLLVTAPINGFVTNLTVNLGKYLNPGEPICDVINKSQPLIQLTVYERELNMMRVGRPVEFRVNGMGKTTFAAQIVSIDQSVDAKDYSIKVYAKVTSSNSDFRPGMYIRAKLK